MYCIRFRCDACRKERGHFDIDVFKRRISDVFSEHIRYCSDNAGCKIEAMLLTRALKNIDQQKVVKALWAENSRMKLYLRVVFAMLLFALFHVFK